MRAAEEMCRRGFDETTFVVELRIGREGVSCKHSLVVCEGIVTPAGLRVRKKKIK
jgi:hypothetical protein